MSDMVVKRVRSIAKLFKNTPFHPQWLSYRNELLVRWLKGISSGNWVLDIGCNDRWAQKILPRETSYFGIDYLENGQSAYASDVDLYSDVQKLGIKSECIDKVLFLDVFEHVPDIDAALTEINRVLKPGGWLILQVPFFYPIHDAPNDYRRLTRFGLERIFSLHGFRVVELECRGTPLESSALSMNIALASIGVKVAHLFMPMLLPYSLLAAPLILFNNVLGWFSSFSKSDESIMPFSYQLILVKESNSKSSGG